MDYRQVINRYKQMCDKAFDIKDFDPLFVLEPDKKRTKVNGYYRYIGSTGDFFDGVDKIINDLECKNKTKDECLKILGKLINIMIYFEDCIGGRLEWAKTYDFYVRQKTHDGVTWEIFLQNFTNHMYYVWRAFQSFVKMDQKFRSLSSDYFKIEEGLSKKEIDENRKRFEDAAKKIDETRHSLDVEKREVENLMKTIETRYENIKKEKAIKEQTIRDINKYVRAIPEQQKKLTHDLEKGIERDNHDLLMLKESYGYAQKFIHFMNKTSIDLHL